MLELSTISEILEREAKVYGDYLFLAARKKEAMLTNNMISMQAISLEEKALTTKLLALESERMKFLKSEGFKADINVRDLIKKLKSPEKEKVQSVLMELEATLDECRDFQKKNKELFRHSTNFINHMIKTFSKPSPRARFE